MVGCVPVGGDAPIAVQSMTNTDTRDVAATVAQVAGLAGAGAEFVRVSCPDEDSTRALAEIVRHSPVPIIADIHFHHRRAIEAAEAGAACLRLNPGNIGSAERVAEVVRAAKDHGAAMRIGVNAGSLGRDLLEKYGEPCPEALVESALTHAAILLDADFDQFKIAVKASDVFLAVAATRQLAAACDHPLHLGITEAGGALAGTVKSAVGLGALLWEGIGDTLRVSLAADPLEEVAVGFEILKALGLRRRGVTIIACPSCAREAFPVIRTVETPGGAPRSHPHPPHAFGSWLRRERSRGSPRNPDRRHRRRPRHPHGLRFRGRRPQDRRWRTHRSHRRHGRGEGRRSRGGRRSAGGTPRPARTQPRLAVDKLQPVRGTHDLLPEEGRRHRHVAETARACAERYGFAEIATPMFEFTEVFARTLGETSDVVTKEMYTFEDRGGQSITLRPEHTAGIVRALLSNGLASQLPLKLFALGPAFRYERPQKGRLRQFHQFDAEILGVPGAEADVEVIALGADVLDRLGIAPRRPWN